MSSIIFSSWGSEVSGSADQGASPIENESLKIPDGFDDGREIKAFMGWDGIVLRHGSVNIVDMAREYMKRAQRESCGQCTPCRLGTRVMLTILERMCEGQGTEADLEQLESLAKQVKDSSMCDIGQTTPIPILHALEHFRDRFEKVIKEAKPVPKGRYISKVTAPCINACPSHLDIPGYVEKIKLGRFDEALETIRNDCCLPGTIGRVCVRPCEFNCRRGIIDDPVSIKFLKRFCADEELAYEREPDFPEVERKKDKVAIVGAGPAGLSCAYYLGLRGYSCTIFESLPEPGGMAAVGIPDYRLPREILRREAEFIEKLGGEIKYNMHLGRDISLEDIKSKGFKAVFLGSGSHDALKMRCEGEDAGYEGFMSGVEFLRRVAFGEKPLQGKKIVVVGGGNVALDCVRSALRLGFEDVNLVYRRTEKEMPADDVEIADAKEEKIKFNFLTQPVKVLAEKGKVVGLECLKMELGEMDESGRRRPVPVEGSNFTIEADAMVPAIGQVTVLDYIEDDSGIETTRWNTVVVDERTFQSADKSVFSGGDCVTGPNTLIAALAAGKNAARFIARHLEKGECKLDDDDRMTGLFERLGVYDPDEKMPIPGGRKGIHLKMLDPETRVHTFDEVEEGMSIPDAVKEASRCLRCYRIGLVAV
jgi:formate dehydrogenase beta subunit